MLCELTTPRGENLTGTPWTAYPRPRMRRDSYVNLNGEWDFAVGEPAFEGRKILVPFCPESRLSGLGEHFPEGTALWYRRSFTLPEDFCRGRVLLHFGAADQTAEVFLNGDRVGIHEGGYLPFSWDITHALQQENVLTVCCRDDLRDLSFPYGKQTMKRGGMWYTPVSGIWQTVWLESVPETYIQELRVENRGFAVTIDIGIPLPGRVLVEGLGEFPLTDGKVTIAPENPHLWSPEDPFLYNFTLEAGEDRVESYFAIRSLEVKTFGKYPRLCLNGKPYFFHGLLDQGYWPEGIYTPPAPESYADDILAMKKLGFNTLRKHIKVEPEEFYYQCDRLGMVVWQDMVNNSAYSFFRDTSLPTAGIQRLGDKILHTDPLCRRRFLEGMEGTVRLLGSYPCICLWTIFNEGWGQFDSKAVCKRLLELDDTRFVDAVSGWFRQRSDLLDSRHVYFRKVQLRADGKKPLILSEFGGKTYQAEGHMFNPDKSYGYGGYRSAEELNQAVRGLYIQEVLPCVERGLCAAIYTQLSDVEDEVNGLVTYDRKIEKMQPELLRPIARQLQLAVER